MWFSFYQEFWWLASPIARSITVLPPFERCLNTQYDYLSMSNSGFVLQGFSGVLTLRNLSEYTGIASDLGVEFRNIRKNLGGGVSSSRILRVGCTAAVSELTGIVSDVSARFQWFSGAFGSVFFVLPCLFSLQP